MEADEEAPCSLLEINEMLNQDNSQYIKSLQNTCSVFGLISNKKMQMHLCVQDYLLFHPFVNIIADFSNPITGYQVNILFFLHT